MPSELVDSWIPTAGRVDLQDALSSLTQSSVSTPFADDRVEFVGELSRSLSRQAQRRPELQALAFWMRKAELQRMGNAIANLATSEQTLMPRGTVFHIPPANVDTMFVYSWILSLLMGNRNIIRMSSRESEQTKIILHSLVEVAAGYPEISAGSLVVSYGHEESITRSLTSVADVRVVWGGDNTVNRIRQIPVRPDARDVTFPDRASLCAIATETYLRQPSDERDEVARKFFNDAFWFDQFGCSSPRSVAWIGTERHAEASQDFWHRLGRHIDQRGYVVEASTAISKLTHLYGAVIDSSGAHITWIDNEVCFIDVAEIPSLDAFSGAGTFYQCVVDNLIEMVPAITRRHQTLTTYGVSPEEVRQLVSVLRGRGIDRIVPLGEALSFDRIWDGMDLLQEFSRKVTIRFGAELSSR